MLSSCLRLIAVFLVSLFWLNVSYATSGYHKNNHGYWHGYGFSQKFQPVKAKSKHRHFHGYWNQAPVAYNAKVFLKQGTSKAFRLFARDNNGDELNYYIVRSPKHGKLTGNAPHLVYTPRPGFYGRDYLKFAVSDGRKVDYAWVKIYVKRNPIDENKAPIADDQSLTTEVDESANITLSGSDADNDSLSYAVTQTPANGVLSGNAPNLTYIPNTGFVGQDQFAFIVNDGKKDSLPATVSITIEPRGVCRPQDSTYLNYSDFSDISSLQLNGDASSLTPNVNNTLRLTQPLRGSGSAFVRNTIPLEDDNGFNASFSSAFSFQIPKPLGISDNDGQGADGLVFVLQTVANNLGANGGGIGYQGINNSLGIEFDTWNNGSVDQHNGNHIGINVNGDVRSKYIKPINERFNDGDKRYVWVDYQGSEHRLEVRISKLNERPEDPIMSLGHIDLADILGKKNAFIGFTSGTGDAAGEHNVLSFQFINRYAPIGDCDNTAPIAQSQSLETNQSQPVNIQLTGSDVDNDALEFSLLTQPSHGELSGDLPNLVYTPALGFIGSDSFTFIANDGIDNSTEATIDILVQRVNAVPVANPQSLVLDEDSNLTITLAGSDANNDSLVYTIIDQPTNGVLTGTAPNLVYTPNVQVNGSDTFTFKVNDGLVDSNIATVTLTINPINDAPIANPQELTTLEDTPIAITVDGSDLEGDALSYVLVTPVIHGVLTGSFPNVVYVPDAHFSGRDLFTFKVNDGKIDSEVATVSIAVSPVNDAPIADSQSVTTDEDSPIAIVLSGSDLDGDDVTFNVQTQPTNGALSGTAPNLTYTPTADFNGNDSFTFIVNDGTVDSTVATVSIVVNPVNDAPIANSQSVTTDEDSAIAILLTGSDLEGDNLNFSVETQPSNGVLSGTAPDLTYTPTADFNGNDSFTFVVNDGAIDSTVATVSIVVNPINDAPIADSQ
ncbi:MAG: Ig-like domain-containing protein, partial [Arenicella sp.]